ncbi:MAG: hypothetical protein V1792_22460 [Pseudomonadota bacterium]
MFEKKNDVVEPAETATEETLETARPETADSGEVADYGPYKNAAVEKDGSDVIITIPVGESVMTIRSPQAFIAQNATRLVAGGLLTPVE